MFHTILTLVYLVPNLYVFIRIGRLFIHREYRFLYALVYIFLALFFPLVNLLPHGETGMGYRVLEAMAGYLLPFYLYLFLGVLLFDLFLLFNWIFRFIPREKMRTTRFRASALGTILLLSLLIVTAGAIHFNTIRTSEYTIEIPRKSSRLDQLKVAFVSDFHLRENTDFGFVGRFVGKIGEIQPDLLLYGGDIVEGSRSNGKMERYEKALRQLSAKYGVYAVLGNHEYYSGNEDGNFFDRSGMKVLCDSVVVEDHLFCLAGRLDSHFSRRKTIGELLQAASDSLPLLLLDHRPTELEQVSGTPVDVQFSGHTHDGQLFPINLLLKRMYRLTWGYEKIGHTHFFVSSGIRMWGPPVRTVGKSEIMVVTIKLK